MIIFRKYKSFLLCIVLGEESLNEEEEEKDTTSHLRGISKTELRCELDVTGLSLHTLTRTTRSYVQLNCGGPLYSTLRLYYYCDTPDS